MKIRKTLAEMAVIVVAAASLGLMYNFFAAPKPLSWVYEARPVAQANDSLLFTPSAAPKPADTTAAQPTALAPVVKSDTVSKQAKPAEENAVKPAIKRDSPAPAAKPMEVKYEQVFRLSSDPDALILDARKEHEFAEGHIPGAKNLNVLEFDKHVEDVIGLPRDKRIVVYCGGGLCELSHDLCNNLIAFGFTRVFIYIGGYEDWKQQQKKQ